MPQVRVEELGGILHSAAQRKSGSDSFKERKRREHDVREQSYDE
jgi:hypothetical protein